jgi:hypothetical protein
MVSSAHAGFSRASRSTRFWISLSVLARPGRFHSEPPRLFVHAEEPAGSWPGG